MSQCPREFISEVRALVTVCLWGNTAIHQIIIWMHNEINQRNPIASVREYKDKDKERNEHIRDQYVYSKKRVHNLTGSQATLERIELSGPCYTLADWSQGRKVKWYSSRCIQVYCICRMCVSYARALYNFTDIKTTQTNTLEEALQSFSSWFSIVLVRDMPTMRRNTQLKKFKISIYGSSYSSTRSIGDNMLSLIGWTRRISIVRKKSMWSIYSTLTSQDHHLRTDQGMYRTY